MKKRVMLVTVVVFLLGAIPLGLWASGLRDERTQALTQARPVATEADFARALASDGWIVAEGEMSGRAPVADLGIDGLVVVGVPTSPSGNLQFDRLKKEALDAIASLGDQLMVRVVVGPVEQQGGVMTQRPIRTVSVAARQVTFLGQTFDAAAIGAFPTRGTAVLSPPRHASEVPRFTIEAVPSPRPGWLLVHVSNGAIVAADTQFLDKEAMRQLRLEAAGGTDPAAMVGGAMLALALVLGAVLFLENRFLR